MKARGAGKNFHEIIARNVEGGGGFAHNGTIVAGQKLHFYFRGLLFISHWLNLQHWTGFYIAVYGNFQGLFFFFEGLFFAFRGQNHPEPPCNFSPALLAFINATSNLKRPPKSLFCLVFILFAFQLMLWGLAWARSAPTWWVTWPPRGSTPPCIRSWGRGWPRDSLPSHPPFSMPPWL